MNRPSCCVSSRRGERLPRPRWGRWVLQAVTAVAALTVFLAVAAPARLERGRLAINYVAVSDRLGTSGMPTGAQFAAMAAAGYQVIINLAPPDALGSHRDEASLAARHGLAYHNLPVDFARPTAADYARFAALLAAAGDRKVLVHCQVNLRASSFVFLHRVLAQGEDPDRAYEAVQQVWTPNRTWREFMVTMLAAHGARRPVAL